MSDRHPIRDNGLSIAFGAFFLLALAGESVAGWRVASQHAVEHGDSPVTYGHYITSSDFGRAVLENWQSEYLQFFLFILLTIWLLQVGSPESKPSVDDLGTETDEQQKVGRYAPPDAPRWAVVRGFRRTFYGNSLLLVMGVIFLLSWLGQSLTGWTVYNDDAQLHDQPQISWLEFMVTADFWEQTLQNWQSEFLAVGSFAIFAVFLRQRGSPESKPVGSPHAETGETG